MAPRLPTTSDFPSSVTVTITFPPITSPTPLSALILLHGLGDTHDPFTRLAQQLSLPSTIVLSLRAPNPVPALITGSDRPSFHWGDDILFDDTTAALDMDAGFSAADSLVWETVIQDVLVRRCGFQERDIMMLGFGQGGMVALRVAALHAEVELAGVVSIGGRLPTSCLSAGAGAGKAKTPVLLLGGSRSSQVTKSAVEGVKSRFVEVEYVKWAKGEDSMPASREEMLPIMRLFGRRLCRMRAPEGAVEI